MKVDLEFNQKINANLGMPLGVAALAFISSGFLTHLRVRCLP